MLAETELAVKPNPQSAIRNPQSFDPTPYRALFPVTREYVYLNHAAVACFSLPAQAAAMAYMAASGAHAVHSEEEWWPHIETARVKMAALMGADPMEVGWVANDSTALNMVVVPAAYLRCGRRSRATS